MAYFYCPNCWRKASIFACTAPQIGIVLEGLAVGCEGLCGLSECFVAGSEQDASEMICIRYRKTDWMPLVQQYI